MTLGNKKINDNFIHAKRGLTTLHKVCPNTIHWATSTTTVKQVLIFVQVLIIFM